MFWDSVLEGLKVLTHWQVWLSIVVYVIIMFIFIVICGGLVISNDSGYRVAIGCFTYLIGTTLTYFIRWLQYYTLV